MGFKGRSTDRDPHQTRKRGTAKARLLVVLIELLGFV